MDDADRVGDGAPLVFETTDTYYEAPHEWPDAHFRMLPSFERGP